MRPTRRGWTTLAGGIGAVAVGRLLGLTELFVIGVGAVALVAIAVVLVARANLTLAVRRDVRPGRAHVGSTCRVELTIVNRSPHRSPVAVVSDPVGDGQQARLRLAPIAPGARTSMRYRLPVGHRGIVSVGPLRVEVTDPFGLSRQVAPSGTTLEVIVLPAIVPLEPIPPAPGDEPDTSRLHQRTLATANEEFSSLREFSPGDDIRKVHWRSTARAGRPIIRHFDEPWQRRTTVVLDVRRSTHSHDSFERAVSAAASVLWSCTERDDLVRLVPTSGRDTGFVSGDHERDAAMDLLAAVTTTGSGSLGGTMRALAERDGGGSLVTCTADLPAADLATLAQAGARFGSHIAVCCGASAGARIDADGIGRTIVVADGDGADLTAAWGAAVSRLRPPSVSAPRASR